MKNRAGLLTEQRLAASHGLDAMSTEQILIHGTEIQVTPRAARMWTVDVNGSKFTLVGDTAQIAAEIGWKAAHPAPSPERIAAEQLATERGETVCDHCGGLGGWRGWPGFTCHKCDGHKTVA